MTKTALIVLDFQKFYHAFPLLKPSMDLSLFTINPTLQLFRQTSNPVFFIQHADDIVVEGTSGFDISDAIHHGENEHRILKHHRNSFYQTTLAEKLQKEQVGFVVICGLAATQCVTATVQGASENGFRAAILQHGVADIKDDLIQTAHFTCPVVSLEALRFYLSR